MYSKYNLLSLSEVRFENKEVTQWASQLSASHVQHDVSSDFTLKL